jgi:hypothetical protein
MAMVGLLVHFYQMALRVKLIVLVNQNQVKTSVFLIVLSSYR